MIYWYVQESKYNFRLVNIMGDYIPGSNQDDDDLHDSKTPALITRTEELIQRYPDMFEEIQMGNMFWHLEKKREGQTSKDRILATRRRVEMKNNLAKSGNCLLLKSLDEDFDIWNFNVQGEEDPNRAAIDQAVFRIVRGIEREEDVDNSATLSDGHKISITYMPYDEPNSKYTESIEPYLYDKLSGDDVAE